MISPRRSVVAAAVAGLVVPVLLLAPAHGATGLTVSGTSSLAVSATADGGPTDAKSLGPTQHDGNFDHEIDATSQSDSFDFANAAAEQNNTATSTKFHSGGTSNGQAGNGTNSVTNTYTATLRPAATGVWKLAITAINVGDQTCIPGAHVDFTGLGIDEEHSFDCSGPPYVLTKNVTLNKGVTYTLDVGHDTTTIEGTSFTWGFDLTKVAAPSSSQAPAISGKAKVGKKLTATKGTWKGSPKKYAYQWYRGTKAVKKATASTYKVVKADVGSKLKVCVSATNAGGTTRACSKPTAKVVR